ncbi:MAG: hypothetical protein Q7U57_09850 [Methylovulum sp.]|nr:hypothetical protein [Methylovulum sp.]
MNMPTPNCAKQPFRLVVGRFLLLLLSAANCIPAAADALDTATVKAIELKIADDQLDQFGFMLPLPQMLARVAANLAEWRYPMHNADNGAYSHTLDVHIGHINNAATPVGFSFSSGDSDPRAAGFQKADVIPVSCRLSSNKDPRQAVELAMDFSAGGLISPSGPDKIIGRLVDDISTVCFDLLDDLQWPQTEQHTQPLLIKPAWMPQVKIEKVPEPPATEKIKTAVKTEIDRTDERKQLIIHNQGSPLILKLGHDRR